MKKSVVLMLVIAVLTVMVLPATVTAKAVQYDLWIGNTQVTSENRNDILGDGGSVKYDAEKNTLYLNNATVTGGGEEKYGYGILYTASEDFVISATGTNTVSDAGERSDASSGFVTGSANPSEASASSVNVTVTVAEGASLSFAGGTVTGATGVSYGVFMNGSTGTFTVNGAGNLTVTGGAAVSSRGIDAANVTVTGGTLEVTCAATAQQGMAMSKAPTLAEGIAAGASENADGSEPTAYDAQKNDTYKWFKAPYEAEQSAELVRLAELFNACKSVQQYKEYGYTMTAAANGDKLEITLSGEDGTGTLVCQLEGNILGMTIPSEDYMGLYTALIVVDCVGQLNGYEDEDLFYTLQSDEVDAYTLAKEGFEAEELSNGDYSIKVDITKKIPQIDLSKVYIKTSDLDEEIVASDEGGSVSGVKTKMSYYISINADGKNEIYIGEKDELTDSTYQSILSVIEVMFGGKDAVEYFKENYTGLSEGNKEFPGFKVELNVDTEVEIFGESKVAKVSVDKQLVKSLLGGVDVSSGAAYSFLEGENLTYVPGKDKTATFRIDADYSLFENGGKVYVDEKELSEEEYTSEAGSTVITLTEAFMGTLSEGPHTLKVVFGDGTQATTEFTVAAAKAADGVAVTGDAEAGGEKEQSPKTGDNGYTAVGVAFAILSLIGMAGSVILLKKKSSERY